MADFPLYLFTTQEDWYGELQFRDTDGNPLSLAGRSFVMPITQAVAGGALVEPVRELTMQSGGGLSLKSGDDNTIIFRVPRSTARAFPRGEFTADVLEVVSGERHLFMPARVRYTEPSALLSYVSRFVGVAVNFATRQQPIITPVAITGRQGAPGATIIYGTAPPVPADGKDGDFFIEDRTASSLGRRMYGPKTGGTWPGTPWSIEGNADQAAGFKVNLGLPAILTIGEEVKARGVVPAARLGITGGTADQTTKWQAAISDALKTYRRPVELNLGASHRVGSRLRFPAGSGIVNPGGASIAADCADFNNTSFEPAARYGENAVILSAEQGAAGVRFDGIRIALSAESEAVFKEKKVQGIVLIGCPDAVVTAPDLSGFNAGALINIQSCKNFLLIRPRCHDSLVHSASTSKVACQLTAILIDGDELLDGTGGRIGSTGRIEFSRVVNLRSTAEVIAAVTDQTDGINVAGIYAEVFILHPYFENVAEPLDVFGRVEMVGGRIVNAGNFGVKLVHGAQGCRINGFLVEGAGIAGVVMQSGDSEPRGVSGNEVRGSLRNIGTLSMPEITVNGAVSPEVKASPSKPGDTFEVQLTDTSATYPVENNLIEVEIQGSNRSTNPIRTPANGSGNVVRYTNRDGTTDLKRNTAAGANTIRRTDKTTGIRYFASSAQAFSTATAVISYPTKVTDLLGEWSGTVFTPKFAGTYQVSASIRFPGTSPSDTLTLTVRQNGAAKKIAAFGNIGGGLAGSIQHTVDMAVGDSMDVTALLSAAQSSSPPGEAYTAITINCLPD